MSAVAKEIVYPFKKDEQDYPYIPVDEMMCPPMHGEHNHSEEELRAMWGRIWRCFKSKELCKSFMFYNKRHSLKVWAEAFETVRQKKEHNDPSKPNAFNSVIRYANRYGDYYDLQGTPSERTAREAEEVKARVAAEEKSKCDAGPPVSEDVARFWDQKAKPVTIDSMPEDHPVFIRMMDKIKGSRK